MVISKTKYKYSKVILLNIHKEQNHQLCKMSIFYWNQFYENYQSFLHILPIHQYTIQSIFNGSIHEIQNILLYGAKGFPLEIIAEYAISKLFSAPFPIQKRYPIWDNSVPYIETNYYICIDTEHPEFPKDIQILVEFISQIIKTKPICLDKHIIIIKHLEQIANHNTCYIFRILLERFSNNVIFVNTTHYIQHLEQPLLSRMTKYRIPLPTISQIEYIVKQIKPGYNKPLLNIRNISFILFHLDHLPSTFLHYPPLQETIHKSLSLLDIRNLSYKLYQYRISVADLIQDCTTFIKDEDKQIEWLLKVSHIEYDSKKNDPNKNCFFLELILSIFEDYKNNG